MNEVSKKGKIDPAEWLLLCHRHANEAYRYHNASRGITKDDMFQSACLGMILASKKHNPEKGGFASYAYWYIKREINRLMYKQGTNKRLSPRFVEPLFDDIGNRTEGVDEGEQIQLTIEEDETTGVECSNEDDRFFDEFLIKLRTILTKEEVAFFEYMVENEPPDATQFIMQQREVTRQRAHQIKNEIKQKAARIYNECTKI